MANVPNFSVNDHQIIYKIYLITSPVEETRWARAQAAISRPVSEHSQALLKLELKEAKKKAKQLYSLVSDREYLLCFGTGFI